ncbi:MAG: VOC family protein [Polyangiaceae bacterium]|nr:VOC family protein [Polyangiaceae bacterium]
MKFVHQELSTSDPAAAKKFYKGLFGWKFEDMKMPNGEVYIGIKADGAGIGGIQRQPVPGAPTAWLGYVEVPSVKKLVAKAVKLGGRVLLDYTPIGDMGAIGIVADGQGGPCGLWEPAKKPKAKAAAKKKPAKKAAKKR